MSCGVGGRYSSEPALLWLWGRPATVAPITLLAWELPYAEDEALKKEKQTKTQKRTPFGSSCHGSVVTNLTSIHKDLGLIPGLAQWVKDHRDNSDPVLLWRWLWPAAAALIGPLAWELPYAEGAALKSQKKKKKRKENITSMSYNLHRVKCIHFKCTVFFFFFVFLSFLGQKEQKKKVHVMPSPHPPAHLLGFLVVMDSSRDGL